MSTGITPLTPEEQAKQEASALHEGYILRSLVALDDAANVILGGNPDETLSSRIGRSAQHHQLFGELCAKFLDRISDNHCGKASAGDMIRAKEEVKRLSESGIVTDK